MEVIIEDPGAEEKPIKINEIANQTTVGSVNKNRGSLKFTPKRAPIDKARTQGAQTQMGQLSDPGEEALSISQNISHISNKIAPALRKLNQAVIKKEMRSIGVGTIPPQKIDWVKMVYKLRLNIPLLQFSIRQLRDNPNFIKRKDIIRANFA